MSDVEKTFIDMVYFREMRRDIADGFRGRIDRGKLERYLRKYRDSFRRKVVELLR